jgi:biopolymer transport protein ExbB
MDILREYLDITIFSLLAFMAFLATWFTLERLLFFRKVQVANYSHQELLTVALTKNLTTISTIGANAPYVGLLGTVLGILVTFYDMGMTERIDTNQIMVNLALALKATAGGIALAIPSIMAYNGLMRRVEVFQSQYQAHQDNQH